MDIAKARAKLNDYLDNLTSEELIEKYDIWLNEIEHQPKETICPCCGERRSEVGKELCKKCSPSKKEVEPNPRDCPVCDEQPYYHINKDKVDVCCMNEHCMIAGIDFWLEDWNRQSVKKGSKNES